MPQHCPRCEATLPVVDGSDADFCAVCGLPQLRVSSEFLQPEAPSGQGTPSNSAFRDSPDAIDWPLALRVLAVATLAGLVPCILLPGAIASGASGIFAILLLPLLCLGSGAAYLRQRPHRLLSANAGARMGVTLSLLLGTVLAISCGIAGFVLRYGYRSRAVENSLSAAMLQSELQMRANSPEPLPASLLGLLHSPEGHAAAFVLIQLLIAALLLVFGAICGALAGALLGARQRGARSV